MDRPVFSFICPAIREYLYQDFYDSLDAGGSVPFEIIFVGHKKPTKTMPDNFRYIYAEVKPAQCLEIAAREAKGEYLYTVADDLIFSGRFLKVLYNYTERLDTDKVFIAAQYGVSGKVMHKVNFYRRKLVNSPVLGVTFCLKKSIWYQLGGVDKRFVSTFCDLDIQMRCLERGMTIFIMPDAITYEREGSIEHRNLFPISEKSSKKLLDSLWVTRTGPDSKYRHTFKNRLAPVEPFDDKDILVENQGGVEIKGYSKEMIKWEMW